MKFLDKRCSMQQIKRFVTENQGDMIRITCITAAVVAVPLLTGGDFTVCEAAGSAANAKMPWTTGISAIYTELTGPLPKIGSGIACAGAGLAWAYGDLQGISKRATQIVFGTGVCVGAPSLVEGLTNATNVAGCLFA